MLSAMRWFGSVHTLIARLCNTCILSNVSFPGSPLTPSPIFVCLERQQWKRGCTSWELVSWQFVESDFLEPSQKLYRLPLFFACLFVGTKRTSIRNYITVIMWRQVVFKVCANGGFVAWFWSCLLSLYDVWMSVRKDIFFAGLCVSSTRREGPLSIYLSFFHSFFLPACLSAFYFFTKKVFQIYLQWRL